MPMNRRSFISALLGAATLDRERLLWVPGKTVYSIPKPRVEPKTVTMVTRYIVGADFGLGSTVYLTKSLVLPDGEHRLIDIQELADCAPSEMPYFMPISDLLGGSV